MKSHRVVLWKLWLYLCSALLAGCAGTSDPNSMDAAQFVLDKGGTLSIVGSTLKVTSSNRLPPDPFAISEIDLNPVLVHPKGEGLTIVDALIVKTKHV